MVGNLNKFLPLWIHNQYMASFLSLSCLWAVSKRSQWHPPHPGHHPWPWWTMQLDVFTRYRLQDPSVTKQKQQHLECNSRSKFNHYLLNRPEIIIWHPIARPKLQVKNATWNQVWSSKMTPQSLLKRPDFCYKVNKRNKLFLTLWVITLNSTVDHYFFVFCNTLVFCIRT